MKTKSKFRSLEMAMELHREIRLLRLPGYLKNQVLRSSLSVALNLSEGAARRTNKDKLRLYNIAYASLRETQVALKCASAIRDGQVAQKADCLGAMIYKLMQSMHC